MRVGLRFPHNSRKAGIAPGGPSPLVMINEHELPSTFFGHHSIHIADVAVEPSCSTASETEGENHPVCEFNVSRSSTVVDSWITSMATMAQLAVFRTLVLLEHVLFMSIEHRTVNLNEFDPDTIALFSVPRKMIDLCGFSCFTFYN